MWPLLILPWPWTSLHGKFRMSCRQCATWCSASHVGCSNRHDHRQQPQSEEPISDELSVGLEMSAVWLSRSYEWINYSPKPRQKKMRPFWCQRLNRSKRARRFCRRRRDERVMAGRHAERRRAASPLRHGGGFRDYRFISRWMAHTRMDWIFGGRALDFVAGIVMTESFRWMWVLVWFPLQSSANQLDRLRFFGYSQILMFCIKVKSFV